MTSDPDDQLSSVPDDAETPWYPTRADVAEAIGFALKDGYSDTHDLPVVDTSTNGSTLLLRVGDGVFPAETGVMADGGFFRVTVERIDRQTWEATVGE